jgi:hypothetical protein
MLKGIAGFTLQRIDPPGIIETGTIKSIRDITGTMIAGTTAGTTVVADVTRIPAI